MQNLSTFYNALLKFNLIAFAVLGVIGIIVGSIALKHIVGQELYNDFNSEVASSVTYSEVSGEDQTYDEDIIVVSDFQNDDTLAVNLEEDPLERWRKLQEGRSDYEHLEIIILNDEEYLLKSTTYSHTKGAKLHILNKENGALTDTLKALKEGYIVTGITVKLGCYQKLEDLQILSFTLEDLKKRTYCSNYQVNDEPAANEGFLLLLNVREKRDTDQDYDTSQPTKPTGYFDHLYVWHSGSRKLTQVRIDENALEKIVVKSADYNGKKDFDLFYKDELGKHHFARVSIEDGKSIIHKNLSF